VVDVDTADVHIFDRQSSLLATGRVISPKEKAEPALISESEIRNVCAKALGHRSLSVCYPVPAFSVTEQGPNGAKEVLGVGAVGIPSV
jgi:hypothetical protein